METEKSKSENKSYPKDNGYFMEYFKHEPGQHKFTVIGYSNHKKCVIGRIYPQYGNGNKKTTYIAVDANDNPIFSGIDDLPALKNCFKENVQELTLISLKDHSNEKKNDAPDKDSRDSEIKEVRKRNVDRENERDIEY